MGFENARRDWAAFEARPPVGRDVVEARLPPLTLRAGEVVVLEFARSAPGLVPYWCAAKERWANLSGPILRVAGHVRNVAGWTTSPTSWEIAVEPGQQIADGPYTLLQAVKSHTGLGTAVLAQAETLAASPLRLAATTGLNLGTACL